MEKGIIYLMTTAVPGLIKIGKTGSDNFERRMYELEHNGYRNVTALKRTFAIEVEDYSEKESLLHTIFGKSRLADTELFAVDINIVIQLLSSFDGTMIFPKDESKNIAFEEAVDSSNSKLIPDGTYRLTKVKHSDNNRNVAAIAVVQSGRWTLLKGSVLGVTEDVGVSNKAKIMRLSMPIDANSGELLGNVDLGECTPSFAGTVVMNAANNGWIDWKDNNNAPLDSYRKKNKNTEE